MKMGRGCQNTIAVLDSKAGRCFKEKLRLYLIGHEEETLLRCKSDDIFDALSALNLTYGRDGGSLQTKVSDGEKSSSCADLLPSSGSSLNSA